jgi:AraC-like DNA-binding protein
LIASVLIRVFDEAHSSHGSRPAMASIVLDEAAFAHNGAADGRFHVAGWRTEPLQLGRGRQCAHVTHGTPVPAIAYIEAARNMVLRTTTLRGGVSLIIPDGSGAPVRLSGQKLTEGHFLALEQHEKADVYLPAGSSVYLVNLPSLEVARVPVGFATRSWAPFLRSAPASALCRTLQELSAALNCPHASTARSSWVSLAIRALVARAEPGTYGRSSQVRRAAVDRARELIHAHPERALQLEDLCKAAGSRPRTMEYGFREYFDVTPMVYVRCVRLNKVRQQLVRAAGSPCSISAVARRWGFAHMGQFSAHYRQLFAETPSMTMARRLARPSSTNTSKREGRLSRGPADR